MFYLLKDEETCLGQPMVKFLNKIAINTDCIEIFQTDLLLKSLEEILRHGNSIVRMRGFEVIKNISANSQIAIILQSQSIIDLTLSLYEKSLNDVLEKLNVIELLKEWFENENVVEVLGGHSIFKLIKRDSLMTDDLYEKKDLIIITLNLFNSFLEEFDGHYMDKVKEIIKNLLKGTMELKNIGLEICLNYLISIENVRSLMKDRELLMIIKNLN